MNSVKLLRASLNGDILRDFAGGGVISTGL